LGNSARGGDIEALSLALNVRAHSSGEDKGDHAFESGRVFQSRLRGPETAYLLDAGEPRQPPADGLGVRPLAKGGKPQAGIGALPDNLSKDIDDGPLVLAAGKTGADLDLSGCIAEQQGFSGNDINVGAAEMHDMLIAVVGV
jgi:hypothetical protein